jgi:hypothetical protein
MATYRTRPHDTLTGRILRTLTVLALGAVLAVVAFTAAVWIWVGTTP